MWVHFDGPDKVEWIPDRDIGGYDSLSDKLTDEGITVWWGQQGATATALNTLRTGTPYKGVIKSFNDDDIDEAEGAGSETKSRFASRYAAKVVYADGDVDWLDLQSLEFESLCGHDKRKSLRRIAWVLTEFQSQVHIDAAMKICDGSEQCDNTTPCEPHMTDESGTVNKDESQNAAEKVMSAHRPKRVRTQTNRYDVAIDGANNKSRKQK